MRFIDRNLQNIAAASLALAIGLTATAVLGQGPQGKYQRETGFCNNNNVSSDDRVSVSDLREMTVAAGSGVSVDAGKNGGVAIRGEDRADVLIRACVQAWGSTAADARSAASAIRISTNGTIKAESNDENNWAVSYQILVPRSTNVEVTAKNGGISIADVDGTSDLRTVNGGLNLENVAGTVKGLTTNGGVRVTLSGFETWERAVKVREGASPVEARLALAKLAEDVSVRPEEAASAGFDSVLVDEGADELPEFL